MTSKLTKSQFVQTDWKEYAERGQRMRIRARIRFDDECGNGHNSFSITGETNRFERGQWREDSGGCIHEEIAKRLPEYAHLIKWHMTDTRGPWGYIGNTTYHAGNRDHNGLLEGERRQIKNGRTGLPAWKLAAINTRSGEEVDLHAVEKYIDAEECPPCGYRLAYVAWCTEGKGKPRDFAAARSCAVWPEATDAQLSLPEEELTALLNARLPALMAEFKAAVEAFGFTY